MNHAQFPPLHYHCSCSCLFDKFDFFDLCRDNFITTTFSSFHTGFCSLVWSLSIKILLFLCLKDEAISSKSHIRQFSYVIIGKELKYFFRCVGAKNFSLHIFEDSVFTNVELTSDHYRRSPLVQGGLEIKCNVTGTVSLATPRQVTGITYNNSQNIWTYFNFHVK